MRTPEEIIEARRLSQKKYRESEYGKRKTKERRQSYYQTDRYRELRKKYNQLDYTKRSKEKWRNSPDGKEYMKNYQKYPNRQAYETSEAGRSRRRRYFNKLRAEIIAILGNKCINCDGTDFRCLQLDHIHGGGTAIRKNYSGYRELLYLRKHLDELKTTLQILCANCHVIKTYHT